MRHTQETPSVTRGGDRWTGAFSETIQVPRVIARQDKGTNYFLSMWVSTPVGRTGSQQGT